MSTGIASEEHKDWDRYGAQGGEENQKESPH